jgi:hypothetical protein
MTIACSESMQAIGNHVKITMEEDWLTRQYLHAYNFCLWLAIAISSFESPNPWCKLLITPKRRNGTESS